MVVDFEKSFFEFALLGTPPPDRFCAVLLQSSAEYVGVAKLLGILLLGGFIGLRAEACDRHLHCPSAFDKVPLQFNRLHRGCSKSES